MDFKVVVKALILDDSKILLVKRFGDDGINPGGLTLPGGSLQFGEKLEDAVVREVKEETGLDVGVVKVNTAWTFRGKDNTQVVGITFLCKPLSREVKLGKELSSYEWVDVNSSGFPGWLLKEIRQL